MSCEYIPIGATLPLTGIFSAFGQTGLWAYRLAVQKVNSEGGIMVYTACKKVPVRLFVLDDKSQPDQASKNIVKLVDKYRVCLILGGWASPLVIEEAKTCSKLNVPFVAAGSGDPILDSEQFKWVFIPHVDITGHSDPFFDFLNSLNPEDRPNKIGIWIEDTNVGRASADIWRRDANKYGYQISCEYIFKEQNENAEIIKKTKNSGADFVFAIFSPKQGIFAIQESKKINFNPKMFAFIRAAVSHEFARKLGPDSDFVTMAGTWGPMIRYPGSYELVKQYFTEKGEHPSCDLGPFFAVAQVALNAILRVGTLDREKIREALSLTDITTVAGPIKFPRGFGHAKVRLVLNQWQKGILHTVWPRDIASAKIIYPRPSWKVTN